MENGIAKGSLLDAYHRHYRHGCEPLRKHDLAWPEQPPVSFCFALDQPGFSHERWLSGLPSSRLVFRAKEGGNERCNETQR